MKTMKKFIIAAALLLAGFATASAQKIKGSDTVLPLSQKEAEEYMKVNPSATVTVTGGGSGVGISALMEGTTDIAQASRRMKFDEKQKIQKEGDKVKETVVAYDALAVVVHPSNPVTNLTREQLEGIFTGRITNWKEVGGPDENIVLVTRPTSSGTRATFQKYALDGNEEASNTSMETDDSGVLLQNVKDTKGAIGYVALSYLTGDAGVATVAIDGAEPTLENTYAGKYPVWTFEHMYTKGEPDEVVSAFLDYIMSDEYGAKMESLGYGVSSKMTNTEH